jgi:valyl-tRNA synthetase
MRCVGPDDEPPGEGWTQDEDVLDTWFSSGLWPFSTLGWPDRTPELAKFYPTSVLVTGYDILFFWVARMMMFGLYAMKDSSDTGEGPSGDVPFRTVALHGMVRDQFGKKMSKSFGNAVDPLDWMDAYGSDALRFTLARGANPGTDVPIGEDWVAGSRNFCNKLWNATRFALINGASVAAEVPPREQLSPADRWMLSRLHATVAEVDALYEDYEFAKATETLYHVVWDEFCDWYLELAKAPLARGGAEAAATRAVLGHTVDVLLKLLHPVIPFVTEQLWTTLTGNTSIVVAPWPVAQAAYGDPDAEAQIAAVQGLVTEIRRFRSDQGVAPSKKVAARITCDGSVPGLAEHADQVRALTRLTPDEDGFTSGAKLSVEGAVVELDLSGAIDVAAERARLEKDLALARKEIDAADAKLANADFVAKAPDQVVAKISARKSAGEADVARISAQLAALS